ncbi:MAG TPA: hypothetical protein VMW53_09675 [archaeon]|nr:hypothetical protein [archaeon]
MKPEKSDSCNPIIIENIAQTMMNKEKTPLMTNPVFSKMEISQTSQNLCL